MVSVEVCAEIHHRAVNDLDGNVGSVHEPDLFDLAAHDGGAVGNAVEFEVAQLLLFDGLGACDYDLFQGTVSAAHRGRLNIIPAIGTGARAAMWIMGTESLVEPRGQHCAQDLVPGSWSAPDCLVFTIDPARNHLGFGVR